MIHFRWIMLLAVLSLMISGCTNDVEVKKMFSEKIEKLVNSTGVDAEEIALGELLVAARESEIDYGYRVFDLSQNKRVLPEEINNVLEDKLKVTIFVGATSPYDEYIWYPKYNGHITRLIMP